MRYTMTLLGAIALAVVPARGEEPAAQPRAVTAADPSRAEDEKAIRAAAEAFARAYNAGDATALSRQYTERAEVIDAEGGRTEGREAIAERFAESFQAEQRGLLRVEVESLRLISPDVALEEGVVQVTLPESKSTSATRYSVIHVKQDGRWLMDRVREAKVAVVTPNERLKDIEWMLGDWTDEGDDANLKSSCRWSEDQNFLLREVTVQVQGVVATKIHQRIGWDPLSKQIKSWEFDAQGGYGESLWARSGPDWVIKYKGVLPDGRVSSATRRITPESPTRIHWESTDAVVGDEVIDESRIYIMVKVPPPAQLNPEQQPAPSTSNAKEQR